MLNRSRSHDPHQDSSYPSIILVQKKEYWYKVDNNYKYLGWVCKTKSFRQVQRRRESCLISWGEVSQWTWTITHQQAMNQKQEFINYSQRQIFRWILKNIKTMNLNHDISLFRTQDWRHVRVKILLSRIYLSKFLHF